MTSHILAVQDLGKVFVTDDRVAQILDGVDFAVDPGQFVCVVGPSGSGKTTLLKCIAGLSSPTAGQVVFEGERVSEPPAKLAVIFQDYSRSLLPWLTIAKNVELPLHKAKFPKADRPALVLLVTHDIDEAVYLGNRVVVLSGAPAKVARDIVVDLPTERHQVQTKNLPRFGELRAEVFDLIQKAKQPDVAAAAPVQA